MINLLKKDIKILIKDDFYLLIILLALPLILLSFLEELNWTKIEGLFFLTSMASLVNFEEGKMDMKNITLSLPITRREYVYSKYLMLPILLAVNIAVVFISGLIIKKLSINRTSIISFQEIMTVIFLTLTVVSLSIPLYYALPSKAGVIISFLSLATISFILGRIDGIGALLESNLINNFAGIGALVLALLIFFISARISVKIFETNDI